VTDPCDVYRLVSTDCSYVTLPFAPVDNILSYDGCPEVRLSDCFVLYCVLKLCTVITTVRWAVLTRDALIRHLTIGRCRLIQKTYFTVLFKLFI